MINRYTRRLALRLTMTCAAAAVWMITLSTDSRADDAMDQQVRTMVNKGIDFLRTKGRAEDGSFSKESGSAVTSICVAAILKHRPESVNDPLIQSSLKYIESFIRPDGGIYADGSKHQNYETCIATLALKEANKDGKYDSTLAKAKAFIKQIQWDETEGIAKEDPAYGGAGYGSKSRPDLSNTSFMIDALQNLGDGADDEAIQKALLFVTRTQNLKGAGNDTKFADQVGDGGFYYTPAAGGSSMAGETADGGLRSYASMTYAGLKSMIFAGLTPDDPRVEAALTFIRKNYSLETNPGMGDAGLFYYYHTFAKALTAAKIDTLDDAEGKPHVWREELVKTLAAAQREDGSWINGKSDRWMEGNPNLVTAYSLLALAYCK